MRIVTSSCLVMLVVSASAAFAAPGVNLRWNACYGDGGVLNRTFACNTNTGSNTLVGSFEMGADLHNVSGLEIVVDLASAGATLPAWWQFHNAGTCRTSALNVSGVAPITAVNCVDWANGFAAGGLAAYNIGQNGANTARLIAAFAVPSANLQDLFAGQEYFAFNAAINNTKTVGTGSCAGCSTPVCLVLNSIRVVTATTGSVTLSGPANGFDSDFAAWQGGVGVVVGSRTGCPQATRVTNRTWGLVKTLYR